MRLWPAPKASPSRSPSRSSQSQEDTSPAIFLEEFSEPEAPEPSTIPLPRMLGASVPQPPPPRAPPAWPWPQPGPLTLPRPAFGGRKAAPVRARAGLSAKYAPPLAASPVQSRAPPGRRVPEPRGPPRPHEPPALHLRGGPACHQKEENLVRRRQDADDALRVALKSPTAGGPRGDFALGAAAASRIKRRPEASLKPPVCACCA